MAFRFFLLLTFIVFGRPQDFFGFLVPFRIALLCTAVCLVATFSGGHNMKLKEALKIKEAKYYFIFYLIMIATIPFAEHRFKAYNFVITLYSMNIIYFYLLISYVRTHESLRKLVFVLCVAFFFYGTMSFLQGGLVMGRLAYGTVFDPNDLAYYLISFFPLAFIFLSKSEKKIRKAFAATAIAVTIVIVLMTGSRGGFLGLAVVLYLQFFTRLGKIKGFRRVLVIVLALAALGLYGHKLDLERIGTLRDIGSDYNVSDEFGRFNIWKQGLHLAITHPITGVGPTCFGMALGNYRASIGKIPKWQVAHNSYVQIVTEVGFIGFYFYLALVLMAISNFKHQIKSDTDDKIIKDTNQLSHAMLVAFAGSLTAAFFLTQGYSNIFTIFFGFSVVNKVIRLEKTVEQTNESEHLPANA